MQSKRFSVAWLVHQSLPHLADLDSAKTRQALAILEAALAHVMPCRFCRNSYAGFRQICGAPACFMKRGKQTSDHFDNYYFTAHNLVNAKLDKPIALPTEFEKVYKRSKSTHAFRCALVEWLAILAMHYQTIEPKSSEEKKSIGRFVVRLAHQLQEGKLWQNARDDQDMSKIIHSIITNHFQNKAAISRAWHIAYIFALCHALHSAKLTTKCAQSICAFFDLNNGKGKAFFSASEMFEAVYNVRKSCLSVGEECESLTEFWTRIESYRAGFCADGRCK